MTTPRTIPAEPKPGERYASNDSRVCRWWVYSEEGGSLVGIVMSESDATLLVSGQATIDRLAARVAELEGRLSRELTDEQRDMIATLERMAREHYALLTGTVVHRVRPSCPYCDWVGQYWSTLDESRAEGRAHSATCAASPEEKLRAELAELRAVCGRIAVGDGWTAENHARLAALLARTTEGSAVPRV